MKRENWGSILQHLVAQRFSIANLLPFQELCLIATAGLRVDSIVDGKVTMRTLVQLDGDVLIFVRPGNAVAGPTREISEQHWKEVQCKLKRVSAQLNWVIRSLTWGTAVVVLVIIALSTLRDVSLHSWDAKMWAIHLLANVVVPVAIGSIAHVGFVRRLLAPVFVKVLRFWVAQHSGFSVLAVLKG